MAAAAPEHPRRVLRDFVSAELCKELEFIHRSCGTVGYRPSVFSTTLPHLAITNCIHLILPFLLLRDRLKDVVEVTFGCKYELFIEFTGVIRQAMRLNKIKKIGEIDNEFLYVKILDMI